MPDNIKETEQKVEEKIVQNEENQEGQEHKEVKKEESNADGDSSKKPEKSDKMSDEMARLLKDMMSHKTARRAAEAEKADLERKFSELQEQIKGVLGDGGITELAKKVQQLQEEEERRLRDAGEFEALKERILSEQKKKLDALREEKEGEVKSLKELTQKQQDHIRKLLVTSAFANSSFRSRDTILTAAFAEKLYGDAFRVEERDGELTVIAYRGKEPLLDADGKPLPFDEALKEIVEADPDKESIKKAKQKGGAGSKSPAGGSLDTDEGMDDNVRGMNRIGMALKKAKK